MGKAAFIIFLEEIYHTCPDIPLSRYEIDILNERDRQTVIDKMKEKYMATEVILLNENYSWWDNEDDDIYMKDVNRNIGYKQTEQVPTSCQNIYLRC
ncbi:hypothetical protein [Oceanobacillus sp. J11TS1]|uniref:hypothetical protein n=1 Tax=Oceanobacillus sp. J11TS1 TaxID=2807191 RepID=UPI001B20F0A5|nr:hypothetical protein [Oceanobacillus sp. J11TS1]GIO25207.1 hypothetical protein J11TS1_37880 [Oceanobacillus sp. J11TS1]